jgi:hypothetical protein
MKKLRLVCVALVVAMSVAVPARAAQELSPFTLVEPVGALHRQHFYTFSTSFAKYTIRNDGFVEQYGWRKYNFRLKAGLRPNIEWVYFYEFQDDLLLWYGTGNSGYLVRLDQRTRKIKSAHVVKSDFEPPILRDKSLVFSDGTIVPL